MKSLIVLWNTLAEELASWCGTSAARDIQTVACRVKTEGMSFMTITLSDFAKDFERSLEQGHVDDNAFLSFKKRGSLPEFLKGFSHLVFDSENGRLCDDPSVDAIFAIRQLTLAFNKIQLDCSPARVDRAFLGYIACEKELEALVISDEDLARFTKASDVLFSQLFTFADLDIRNMDVKPKHGPGATADRLRGNAKWDQKQWTWRLEAVFPYGSMATPSDRFYEMSDRVEFLEPSDELPVRVITVPKTLKTPRIIAIEPTCMQYVQQAILGSLMDAHRRDEVLYGVVGFDDQGPNRVLARLGSITGDLATLDLSEASDRVSNRLVEAMLRNHSFLRDGVAACRSTTADVPGHGIIPLTKFASMGSALCFPFEAFVFTTVVFDAISEVLNRPVSRKLLKEYSRVVRVYGDDIIVPVEFATAVRARLETFGFKVNVRKSFSAGKFRESCGGDYYDGQDVTPVRIRRQMPTELQHAQEIASLVATRNLFYKRGLWQTACFLDGYLGKLLKHYPVVHEESPVLGRLSFLPYIGQKSCPRLHRPLVKGYTIKGTASKSTSRGEAALLKFHLARGNEPLPDGHLDSAGRDQAVYLKLGWNTPY